MLLILKAILLLLITPSLALSSSVKIEGKKGRWSLKVDGKPFFIKGVGCGIHKGKSGQDYLKLAQELGANSVRTWGIDQGTKEYLDTCLKYNLKVCAGIWIDYATSENNISFLKGPYRERKEREVLDYVRKFKDHPAIILWGLGNECIFFTADEEERKALCKFLENLIKKIHKIDPDHPVVYASSNYLELKYLKEYVPSLDVVGMNIYPTLRPSHGVYRFLDFNKPYLVTEYGPPTPGQSQRDENNLAQELPDWQKSIFYREITSQIREFRGFNLGGFAFHLGETTQESMTWWNINYSSSKKKSFWTIYSLYTSKDPENRPPRIEKFRLERNKVPPQAWIGVSVEARDPEEDTLRYEFKISTAIEGVLKYYVNKFIDTDISKKNYFKIKAPSLPGIYRIYVFLYDDKGNVASLNRSLKVE